jgi:hypothetical protein
MRYLTLLLLPLALAAAPATKPKPAAATAPSNDSSGPRAALLLYDKLVAGPDDADKALGLYHATTTRDRALAEALSKCDAALATLRAKATKKFGADIADAMLHVVNGTTTKDINTAKITVNGDTATVSYAEFPNAATLVRVNGEWKISIRHLLNGSKSNPREFRKALAKITTSIFEIANKIEQGQYRDPEDASKALTEAQAAAFGRRAADE